MEVPRVHGPILGLDEPTGPSGGLLQTPAHGIKACGPFVRDQAAKGRIQAWEKALGVVAVCTSPILVEPGKQEQEMLVDNRARLQRLGEAGSRGALSQGIGAVGRIPGGEGAPAISAAMAAPPERHAYLLAVAGLELVRASTSELAQHRKASHMAAILEYLHRQAAPDFTYLKVRDPASVSRWCLGIERGREGSTGFRLSERAQLVATCNLRRLRGMRLGSLIGLRVVRAW